MRRHVARNSWYVQCASMLVECQAREPFSQHSSVAGPSLCKVDHKIGPLQASCKKRWGEGSIGGSWIHRAGRLASWACGPPEPSPSLVSPVCAQATAKLSVSILHGPHAKQESQLNNKYPPGFLGLRLSRAVTFNGERCSCQCSCMNKPLSSCMPSGVAASRSCSTESPDCCPGSLNPPKLAHAFASTMLDARPENFRRQ